MTEPQALDRPTPSNDATRIAVLLPCRNEESTIGEVVSGFRSALPDADLFVYDNGSTDRTAERATAAGAIVRREPRPGKGAVVCRMFADVDADVYVIADGDGTYEPSSAPAMIRMLIDENLDMVIAARQASPDAYPRGHVVGNRMFNALLRPLFGVTFSDVFSGYRALSRRFVKSFPARFTGFEVETELSAHAAEIDLPYAELDSPYRARARSSSRKLRTLRDGSRILIAAILLFKEMRPLLFFSLIAGILTLIAVALGAVVVEEFLATGLVPRLPTAVLAASIQIVAFICLTAGLILDSVCRSRREAKRLAYLRIPGLRSDVDRNPLASTPPGGPPRSAAVPSTVGRGSGSRAHRATGPTPGHD